MSIFQPSDILIPNTDLEKWSVVACDQFTSEPEYWEQVEKSVGDEPSALHLMLPEAWLGTKRAEGAEDMINAAMELYQKNGVFDTIQDSFIFIERTVSGGKIRRGLVGVFDLEKYDYMPGSASPVRATERTVTDRLPPRVAVRMKASLEMPHIMVLVDDTEDVLFSWLGSHKEKMLELYDFDLMQAGGHIQGWRVNGSDADKVEKILDSFADEDRLYKKYALPGCSPVLFAMGDGNHSLAAAKQCWETIRSSLSEEERNNHPARFALAEIVNVQSEAITFEPIHRLITETDVSLFMTSAEMFASSHTDDKDCHTVRFVCGENEFAAEVGGLTIGRLIAEVEQFCQDYISEHMGKIDYIHGDETVKQLASEKDCCAVILPAMDKSELFMSVMKSGVFPCKSFSIGNAPDKRYYLECRRIIK